jgi:hypothetical protein
MDRAPADAEEAARQAIVGLEPPVQLRRLRMRQAAGRVFADVVIAVPYDAAVPQGHAAADAVERAVQSALPEADVVVHVEPIEAAETDVRERAHAAALNVPRVREVHNVSVVSVDSGTALSLHLKLPGDLSLEEAHAIAEQVERAIEQAVPEVSSVQTHLEPLGEKAFRAPVLHPPSVRIFDEAGDFVFANPAAVKAAEEEPGVPGAEQVERVAAINGADGEIGGFTPLVEWVAPQLQGAKQRDFALTLGPFVTTPDEGFPAGVDWEGLVSHAAENTTLYPGDLIVR